MKRNRISTKVRSAVHLGRQSNQNDLFSRTFKAFKAGKFSKTIEYSPVYDEHHAKTQHRANQTRPFIEIAECWSKSWTLTERHVETREVDYGISGQKEVRNDWRNCIKLPNKNAGHRDAIGQYVGPSWLVTLAVALAEHVDVRIEVVFAQRLKDLGQERNRTGLIRIKF